MLVNIYITATCKLWEKVKITKLKKYFLYYSLLSTFNNISIILPEILWLSVLHRGRVVMKSQYYLYFLGIIWSLPLQVINLINANMEMNHCVKSGQIRTRNNSVFGHFSRSVYHLLYLYLIWNAMLCVYICWTLKLVFLLVLKRLHNNIYSDFLKYCTNKSIAYQKEVALIFKEVAWFQQMFHICYSLLKLNQDLAFSLVGKTIFSFPLKTSITYNLDK